MMETQTRKLRTGKTRAKARRFWLRALLAAALFLALAVFLAIRAAAPKVEPLPDPAAGYYDLFVAAAGEGCRVGLVTQQTATGAPQTIEALETEGDCYALSLPYGGEATLIVAAADYSFNRVDAADARYYTCKVTCLYSKDPEEQAAYETQTEAEPLPAPAVISSQSTEALPELRFYADSSAGTLLAQAGVGQTEPQVSVWDLQNRGEQPRGYSVKPDEIKSFTFTATGDNLIHSTLYQQAARRSTTGGYDFSYNYANVADFYLAHDINWINQETLCNNQLGADTYPTFSTPGECAQALYQIGFRLFSISNNHTYDKGAAGLAATADFWQNDMPDDILVTGLWDKDNFDYIPLYTYEDKTFAVLAYTYGTNGIPTPSASAQRVIYTDETDIMEAQVRAATQLADFVIVGCHWGIEDSHVITDSQRILAQQLADWGADLIIGTHPHVVQDAQWVTAADGRQVFCAYSLGNFDSAQAYPDELVGLVLDCKLQFAVHADGSETVSVEQPQLLPVVTHYDWGYANNRVYLLRDYSAELANSHGVRARGTFSLESIRNMLLSYVSEEFLVLPY